MAEFKNVLSLNDLKNIIKEVVLDIRRNAHNYNKLVEDLAALRDINQHLDKDLNTLFNAYKKIQSISMEMRRLLSKSIQLEVYDHISYSLYYKNERYSLDTIDISSLRVSSKGTLELNIKKATSDIEDSVKKDVAQKSSEIFNNHYMAYQRVILGTYRGDVGKRGSVLNLGHIAEAYEEHLGEHHSSAYETSLNIMRNIDQMILSQPAIQSTVAIEKETLQTYAGKWWAKHESLTSAWQHVRNSLGTQRGTVAGDVGRFQVKQAKDDSGVKIRLARLKTIQDGLDYFDAILSNDNADVVAMNIAKYMSEPVNKASEKLIDNITDETVKEIFNQINNNIGSARDQNITLVRI